MGKKSRTKEERRALRPVDFSGLSTGVQFKVGIEVGSPLPILLHFAFKERVIFPSQWNVHDAETIAMALLKHVEKYKNYMRELQQGLDAPKISP